MGCANSQPKPVKTKEQGATEAAAVTAPSTSQFSSKNTVATSTVAETKPVATTTTTTTTTITTAPMPATEKPAEPTMEKQGTMNLGAPLPNFECETTQGKIKLHDYFGGGWGVLFSHPADFTPVCTTELNVVLQYLPQFTKRNCKVIALSCDPVDSHNAWGTDVVAYSEKTRGGEMTYPIIADPKREIAVKLGMLDAVAKDASGLPLTARAVFVFGPEKTLKLSLLYPATTGRNFDEIIRAIDSLQRTAQRKLATPAGWTQGEDCIVSTSVSQEDAPKLFPSGVTIVDLPSKKPYLRFTADPGDAAPATPAAPAAVAAPAGAVAGQAGLNLGDEMPNFEADTTQGKIRFHDFLGTSWGVLFSHPADFTPVCTTELAAVAKLDEAFRLRDVKVACISCDPVDSHLLWSQDILAFGKIDKSQLPFPIIADADRSVATRLGMLDAVSKDAAGLPNTCRAVFVIGSDKKLKLSILYPATTGRNFNEIIRVIDSLQLTATRRLATPANWIQGQECIVASSVTQEEATKLFTMGVRIVDLPSKKPYLRFTPQPPSVPTKSPVPSAEDFSRSDEQLKADDEFKSLFERFNKPCSEESLQNAVKSLEGAKHEVKVFNTKKEALEYLASLIKDGVSISMGYSTTLEQLGFIEYLKLQDSRINNFKGKAAKAMNEGNYAEHGRLLQEGSGADLFITGAAAVAETGEIISGDASGTRTNGFWSAKRLVVVTGTNKVVRDIAEAKQRLHQYQLKLESARARVAYKVPGSVVANEVVMNAANPFGPRTTVVLVKESLGF